MESIQDRIIGIGIYLMAGFGLLATYHRFADSVFLLENISRRIGGQSLEVFFLKYF